MKELRMLTSYKTKKKMDTNVVHDFYKENETMLVFCGYVFMKKPLKLLIANVLLLACQFSVYTFLIVMGLYTMSVALHDKLSLIKAFHTFWLLVLVLTLRAIKSFTARSLKEGNQFIKNGIFDYDEIKSNELHYEIIKKRVSLIRIFISACTKFLLICVVVNTFLFPVWKWLTIRDDTSKMAINPYLPVHFYMPFDTRTYHGFSIALFLYGCFFFFMFISVIGMELTYVSFSLQLIAQMEILNLSIQNIEQRAAWKFAKMEYPIGLSVRDVYKKQYFQRCLYSCLRENILHHHAILRFKKVICTYLEAINGFGIWFYSLLMATSLLLILEEPGLHVLFLICAESLCYFMVNLIGEIVMEKSNETAYLLYSMPWPHCSESFKIIMKIMLTFLRHPMVLRSTGFSSVACHETFADMVALGYKIVNVVR